MSVRAAGETGDPTDNMTLRSRTPLPRSMRSTPRGRRRLCPQAVA